MAAWNFIRICQVKNMNDIKEKRQKRGSLIISKMFVFTLITAMAAAGCSNSKGGGESENSQSEEDAGAGIVNKNGESLTLTGEYDDTDLDSSWDEASSTVIQLNKTTIETNGDGVTVSGTKAVITKAGTYVVRGTLDDGQIIVEATNEDLVRIVLDNAELSSSTSAPVYCKQADRMVLILADGSTNVISDGTEYEYDDDTQDEPNAAIFSKDDLTINGNGSLEVKGNYNNGIGGKDDVCIASGNITIDAANDGIKGKDSLTVVNGTIQVTSEGDGLISNNDTEADKGWILIENGTFNIQSKNDGIQAETELLIMDGTFEIISNEGSANAVQSNSGGKGRMGPGGKTGGMPPDGGGQPNMEGNENMTPPEMPTDETGENKPEMPTDETGENKPEMPADMSGNPPEMSEDGIVPEQPADDTASDSSNTGSDDAGSTEESAAVSDSYKGIKSGTALEIRGGTFTIDSADDALHSNGSVMIENGVFTLSSGDDGIHSDETLIFNGGAVTILKSYEGIEGSSIILNDGKINLVSSDDGANSAGGSDDTDSQGTFGQDNFGSTGDHNIQINGGTLVIDAGGDGLDANGSAEMTGGTLIINGPVNGGNGALDYDGSFEISGGILVAAGSSGMAMGLSNTSTQASLMLNYTNVQEAGTLVHLETEAGESILTFVPAKDYQNIIISCPSMKTGTTYKMFTGGTESDTDENGLAVDGSYTNGTEVVSISLEEINTSITDTGEAFTGAMGGQAGRRGKNPQRSDSSS